MFGAYIRAILTVGIAVLMSAILQFIAPMFLQFQGAKDSILYAGFEGIINNALFIMLIAIGAGLLARAVTESQAGVR